MTFFDWLATGQGVELTNVLIAFLVALTAYLTYRTHQATNETKDKVQEQIDSHGTGDNNPARPPGSMMP